MALFDNAQGKWSLSNGVWSDSSGNANTLISVGSPTQTVGHATTLSSAATFSSGNYLGISDASQTGLDITGNFAQSIWVRRTTTGVSRGLMSKWSSLGSQGSWQFSLTASDTLSILLSSDGTTFDAFSISNTPLAVGVWHHCMVVYNSVDVRIYLNANLDSTPLAYTGTIFNSTADFTIGNHADPDRPFVGDLDDPVVYSRAPSAAEVSELFNLGDNFQPHSLFDLAEGKWPLNDDGVWSDQSTNANNLTENGAVTTGVGFDSTANSAAVFVGNNADFLSISDASQTGLDGMHRFVFSGRFLFNNLTINRVIFSKDDGGAGQFSYDVFVTTGGILTVRLSDDGTTLDTYAANTVLSTATWYSFVAVFDGLFVEIYVNGVLDMTPVARAVGIFNGTSNFKIANISASAWDGSISDVAVISRHWSASEIAENELLSENFLPASSITLFDLKSDSVVPRVGTSASVQIAGTYTGTPTTIQSRIVLDGTSTEVVTWTVIDAAPSGGVFNSPLLGVPHGGYYNAQVRFSNDLTIFDNGFNNWGIGRIGFLFGQSLNFEMSTIGTDNTADSLLSVYNKTTDTWVNPGTTGNGLIALGNKLIQEEPGIPVGIYNAAIGATALRQEADSGNGYWLDNNTGSIYDDLITGITAIGGVAEFGVWDQGETDALSGLVTRDEYASAAVGDPGLEFLITNRIRSDITNGSSQPNLPIFVSILGRDEQVGAVDVDWQAIRDAQQDVINSVVDCYFGCWKMDLLIRDAFVHLTTGAYTIKGERLGQAISSVKGDAVYHLGPRILEFSRVSDVITYTVTHDAGTDFIPTSAITGFEVFDDGVPAPISSVVRGSATTVTLTLSSAPSGFVSTRYQYGANPSVLGALNDNASPVALPLIFFTLPVGGSIIAQLLLKQED